MTRNEREEMIRHYMAGEMSMAEEHDFFIQVALDNELRIGLKAHRTIEGAIMKDREIDPSEYAPLGASVAAMLAASKPAPGMPGAGHAGWSLPGGSFLTALCTVGVMFGSLLVTPFLPAPSLPGPRASIMMAVPAAVPTTAPREHETPGGTISPPDVPGESAILNSDHPLRTPGKTARQETAVRQESDRGGIERAGRQSLTKPARRGDDSMHIGVRTIILPPKK